jgi:hypothetical protein
MRINRPPPDFRGTIPLQGSGGAVTSIPFLSIGAGRKRMTIIGGTYFRLFPLGLICSLIGIAERRGFIPMIYLHPYDMDESAAPLGYPLPGWLRERAGDRIRRVGRARVADKVQLLGQLFRFESIKVALGM